VSIHDLHIWALTSGKASLTAHVVHDGAASPEAALLPALQALLAERFDLHHTTLQCESVPCAPMEEGCRYIARPPAPEDIPHRH